ncbi:GHKL domain-containing protein [Tissierella creatinini]|nr:GHKL domain-containing protein [Tissierella creatinini]TJX62256.1 GHKL domain-containing protein [Soehngenia saccharolytica]
MEKKIYQKLLVLITIIVLVTSMILTFLFYEINLKNDQWTLLALIYIIFPVTIGILVFIWIFLYFFSNRLTSSILKPLRHATHKIESILSGDEVDDVSSYKELDPFIKTIQKQKNEIEKSIKILKESEEYRREFTANVTHELKTPLTSINGYAEMIASGMTNEEDTKKFAGTIHKEGLRLLGLIDSIINLSRIEGQVKNQALSFESVDLFEIGSNTVSRLKNIADDKGISLSIVGGKTVLNANKQMMEDLFSNLIDNAIKYNKENGTVDVSVYVEEELALIKVRDTGMGISKEEQARVFERFYRVDKSRSKRISGTGIGLSIVKHIVEYYKGTIYLNSEKGQGTEIEIKLPINQ